MNQFLKDHQLNKAEFGVTDGSISVWISGPQDKNPSTIPHHVQFCQNIILFIHFFIYLQNKFIKVR